MSEGSSQMGQRRHKIILFLCTGNYYRSRFAEILFNSVAGEPIDRSGGPQQCAWPVVIESLPPGGDGGRGDLEDSGGLLQRPSARGA